jgi:hypothetical protein
MIEAQWLVNGGHGASLRHHHQPHLLVTPELSAVDARRAAAPQQPRPRLVDAEVAWAANNSRGGGGTVCQSGGKARFCQLKRRSARGVLGQPLRRSAVVSVEMLQWGER